MQAPKAKKIPKELIIHNDKRVDDYFWLNDRENPEVIDYLNKENEYTKEVLKSTEDFQANLYDEMVGRIKKDDSSVPYKKNGYWYYTRYIETDEYPIYCRKKDSMESEEQILLDVNKQAEGHSYYAVAGMSVSPDNKMLAFGEDTVSRRIYTIRVLEIETGKFTEVEIHGCSSGAVWANDNQTLFYTLKDEKTLRSAKIMSYNIETKEEQLRYTEEDDTFNCHVYKSKSKKYMIIASGARYYF